MMRKQIDVWGQAKRYTLGGGIWQVAERQWARLGSKEQGDRDKRLVEWAKHMQREGVMGPWDGPPPTNRTLMTKIDMQEQELTFLKSELGKRGGLKARGTKNKIK